VKLPYPLRQRLGKAEIPKAEELRHFKPPGRIQARPGSAWQAQHLIKNRERARLELRKHTPKAAMTYQNWIDWSLVSVDLPETVGAFAKCQAVYCSG
jgi:hypothetical protein